MEWLAIVAGVCVVWFYLNARGKAEQQKQDELYELQFWEADHDDVPDDVFVTTRAHFPSMLMRYNFASMGLETFRLHLLRRRGDGIWERMFTYESFQMEMEAMRTNIFQKDELAALETEGNIWRAIDVPTLETAYQRFIHAQGVRVVDVAARWKAEEAEHHQQERVQRRPDTKPVQA